MNTKEIERFLQADIVCRGVFQEIFSAGTQPRQQRLLVCNTDESTKPGQHWIAIHVDDNGHGEYFDSFWRAPDEHFEAYMNRHCTRWTFNREQLQSIISSSCGYHCCVFCMLSCRRVEMTRIVNMFTTDTAFNYFIAHSFVCTESFLKEPPAFSTHNTRFSDHSHLIIQRKHFSTVFYIKHMSDRSLSHLITNLESTLVCSSSRRSVHSRWPVDELVYSYTVRE